MSFRLIIFILAMCVAHTNYAQKKKTQLVYHFQTGQEIKLWQETKQAITQEINGEKQNIQTTMSGGFHFKVLSLRENVAKIETKYENIRMTSETPFGKIEMDSNAPDSTKNIFSKLIKSICNVPFYIEMNQRGIIEKVEGMEMLIDSMVSKFDTLPKLQKDMLRQQLNKQLGAESLKGSLEMALVQYPQMPIKKGGTWNTVVGMRGGIKANINHKWQLLDIQKNTAKVNSNAEIKTLDPNEITQMNSMDIKTDLQGNQTTESEIDLTSGWPVLTSINSQIKGVMRMIQFEMDVPCEFKTTSTFKFTKIK